ncbi:MAG: hypothetical protein IPJ94_16550 [Chloroflexi bacterium]|nr:hypothetical protein [Chloroflexota bacterium]
MTLTWAFLHLPLTIGIVAGARPVLNVVENAGVALPLEVRFAAGKRLCARSGDHSFAHGNDSHSGSASASLSPGRRAGLAAAVFIALLGPYPTWAQFRF